MYLFMAMIKILHGSTIYMFCDHDLNYIFILWIQSVLLVAIPQLLWVWVRVLGNS